ncbi:MAG: di-heme oxidoredictase family protein [Archangium sp.]
MRGVLVLGVLTLVACEPLACGGGRGVVLSPNPEEVARCRDRQRPVVTPLFIDGPADTSPAVVTRGDGVIVTTIGGRVRGRHERETRFASYDSRSYENRSYAITIEDAVAAGRSEIVVTFMPAADVSEFGPGTNFRHWKVYGPAGNNGGGYTFAVNIGMNEVTPRELVQTVTQNVREGRALQTGDILDFELGIYLAGVSMMDPNPIPGGSAYFSDTFRYQVGVGGLTPENFDDAGVLGPSVRARLGGQTTVPWVALADGTPVAPEYGLSQLALNAQPPHAQTFLEGRRLFFTSWDTGAHAEGGNPAIVFATPPLGPTFSAKSCVACHVGNGREVVNGDVVTSEVVTLSDGELVTLTQPVDAGVVAPPLVGLGLLESVDEDAVLELADENDCDGDGISGRASLVNGQLGRFGWQATGVSLSRQVSAELEQRHGVTPDELDALDRARLETYTRLLGVLPQRPVDTEGEGVFNQVGCAKCHVDTVITGSKHPFTELRAQTIRPFTDLLLHDVGMGEFRTAPLWNVGVSGSVEMLHDGRAHSVLEAILWHGGEATSARNAVISLPSEDRAALVRFVESL